MNRQLQDRVSIKTEIITGDGELVSICVLRKFLNHVTLKLEADFRVRDL